MFSAPPWIAPIRERSSENPGARDLTGLQDLCGLEIFFTCRASRAGMSGSAKLARLLFLGCQCSQYIMELGKPKTLIIRGIIQNATGKSMPRDGVQGRESLPRRRTPSGEPLVYAISIIWILLGRSGDFHRTSEQS